jgi:cytochrome P450
MNRYLSRELDHCFALYQQEENQQSSNDRKHQTFVSLALDKYAQKSAGSETRDQLNKAFKDFVICQLKGIILAGHGTTANTLCFIYYLLSSNPTTLRRIREEHDFIFGVDLEQTAFMIARESHLLNQVPYTLAVIKEALRLYPADSSARRGEPGFSLSQDGQQYPTEGCDVWTLIQAIHRDARYWPQGDTFIPERWLCSKDDPLYPIKGAWRAFEFGPRNCIGQELSLLEMKLALVMTIRRFDFHPGFDEWDQTHGKRGPRTVNGEAAYTVLCGTNRPRDGMPCRVSLATD